MPSSDSAPNFALLTECDLRDLSAVNLYRRGSQSISISLGDAVYLDMLHFLMGYSSQSLWIQLSIMQQQEAHPQRAGA